MRMKILQVLVAAGVMAQCVEASAFNPNGRGPIIAQGEMREQLEATPILQRPYRPLHVYGNTVRRRHYRGPALSPPRAATGLRRN